MRFNKIFGQIKMLCSFKIFFYSLSEEMFGGQSREFACGYIEGQRVNMAALAC